MAEPKELFKIVKDNQELLKELYNTLKTGVDSDATGRQLDDFKKLVERIRKEILDSKDRLVSDVHGQPDPITRKKIAEETLKAVEEAKKQEGLSEGDIALLEARAASLGITIASSSFERMEPLGQLLSEEEWNELVEHFEEATKDLANRKKAKAVLDGAVKLAILAAKVASKL